MAECVEMAVRAERNIGGMTPVGVRKFTNAIEAMQAIDEGVPEMIFLDVLLDGPDGFTFLNELASYEDTARVPVVIISSLDLGEMDLSIYGVVKVLNKAKMRPEDISECVWEFCGSEYARTE